MKIAQITTLNSPNFDGVTSVVMNLSMQLFKLGNQVDILAVDSANDLPRYETINGITLRRFKSTVLFKRIIPHWEFLSFLRKNLQDYDVIHIHGFSALSAIIASYMLRTIKGESIAFFTPHYHKTNDSFVNIFRILYDMAWRGCLKEFNKIIFVSKAEQTIFADCFGTQGNSVVVYNGINLDLIQEAKPYDTDEMLVMYVGGLRKYKNIANIIYALPRLPACYKLAIIGNGPQKIELEEITQRLGLTSRVMILSNVATPDLYRWYKTCRVVVNLSRFEAFGIVLIEALSAGKHVVCSDILSFKEIATEFDGIHQVIGFGADSELLAEAIQQMAMMPPPDNHTTIQRVTWSNIGQEVNNLYGEIVDTSNER